MIIKSLKAYLVVSLLLCISVVTVFSIVGDSYLEHRDFYRHLDSQLTVSAYTIQALTVTNSSDNDHLHVVQHQIENIMDPTNTEPVEYSDQISVLNMLFKSIQFIVWDKSGQRLLHSIGAPDIELADTIVGFQNLWLDGVPWRIYSTRQRADGLTVAVLQEYAYRTHMEKKIIEDSLIMLIALYPIMSFLIWLIVGQALSSLNEATEQLRKKDSHQLTRLKIEKMPREIEPLVNSINDLLQRLELSFEREKNFAGDAAHELKTPLAAISTHTQLAATSTGKKQQEALANILKGINRSTHTINQLLTLSRTLPEKSSYDLAQVNIMMILRETIALLMPLAHQKHIDISLESHDMKHMIIGNETLVNIMLRNLIDNAIRYSPENTVITISIDIHEQHLEVAIIDQGPGIPNDLKKRVFERFYRVLGTKTDGSGLGLNIVHQIAKLMHAEITFSDNPDHSGLCALLRFKRALNEDKAAAK